MKIHEIKKMPTLFKLSDTATGGIHQSLFRSYHLLDKVVDWLQKGVCPEVVLEMIEDIETPYDKENEDKELGNSVRN